jgi:hypothetical protein
VQAVDAKGAADSLHDGDLGREGHAVVDDQILADADELIRGGVSIRDEEESDQVQPGMAEGFEVAEDEPVILRADREIAFPLGQRGRACLFQEKPGRAC